MDNKKILIGTAIIGAGVLLVYHFYNEKKPAAKTSGTTGSSATNAASAAPDVSIGNSQTVKIVTEKPKTTTPVMPALTHPGTPQPVKQTPVTPHGNVPVKEGPATKPTDKSNVNELFKKPVVAGPVTQTPGLGKKISGSGMQHPLGDPVSPKYAPKTNPVPQN